MSKKNVILELHRNDVGVLRTVPDEYWEDDKFCKDALNTNRYAIFSLPEKYRADPLIILNLVKEDYAMFDAATKDLKKDMTFVWNVFKIFPQIIVREEYFTKENLLMAINKNREVLTYCKSRIPQQWWPEVTDAYLKNGGFNLVDVNENVLSVKQAKKFIKKSLFNWDRLPNRLTLNTEIIILALKSSEYNEFIRKSVRYSLLEKIKTETLSAKSFLKMYDGNIDKDLFCILSQDPKVKALAIKHNVDMDEQEKFREVFSQLFLKEQLSKDNELRKKNSGSSPIVKPIVRKI